jgi:hypothetical protein
MALALGRVPHFRRVGRPQLTKRLFVAGAGIAISLFTTHAMAIDVANQGDWNTAVAAVAAASSGSTVTINLTSGFTLTSSLAQLSASASNVIINIGGNRETINGASSYQGITVNGANAPTVNISDLTITATKAQGGNGASGADGGAAASLELVAASSSQRAPM